MTSIVCRALIKGGWRPVSGGKLPTYPYLSFRASHPRKKLRHSAISRDSTIFRLGGKMLGIRDVNWALPSLRLRLRAGEMPSDISSPSIFPPSLKVALSLKLAMTHFIPGCTALSDKTGVNSHSPIFFDCSEHGFSH